MAFAGGVTLVGSLSGWASPGWGSGDVNINANRYNNINVNRRQVSGNTWRHDTTHRQGVAYRNQEVRDRYRTAEGAAAARDRAQSREQFRGRVDQVERGRRSSTAASAATSSTRSRRCAPSPTPRTTMRARQAARAPSAPMRGASSPLPASATGSTGRPRPGDAPQPYHGYLFRILERQGPAAPGGAFDYVVGGRMIGGFAVIAMPYRHGTTGIMTFMISHHDDVWQANLGPDTARIAAGITAFDPGEEWEKAAE